MNVRNFPKPPLIVPPIYRNETISHYLLIIIILYQKYICKRYVFFIYNIKIHHCSGFWKPLFSKTVKGEFRVSGAGSDVRLYLLRKLYFDFVKVIFWLSPKLYFGFQPKLRYLSITCPQGKYHCNAISLSKTISLRKQYHCR